MSPAEPVTLERVFKFLFRNIRRLIGWADKKAIRVSLAMVIVLVAVDVGIVVGVIFLLPPPSSTTAKPASRPELTRLPEAVDLGLYCGEPASGNLTRNQCQWEISDFDKVCESQYPAASHPALPRPLHIEFSDPNNPSSGQCYASNSQVVGGVRLSDYCNAVLVKRPAGVDYVAAPVDNTNRWICERKLDILAVCVSTFQVSNLEARVDKGKVVCYLRN